MFRRALERQLRFGTTYTKPHRPDETCLFIGVDVEHFVGTTAFQRFAMNELNAPPEHSAHVNGAALNRFAAVAFGHQLAARMVEPYACAGEQEATARRVVERSCRAGEQVVFTGVGVGGGTDAGGVAAGVVDERWHRHLLELR